MSNYNLYPPSINTIAPAFVASDGCDLYFSLSKFSSNVDPINSIHLSITKQSTGLSVVNKSENSGASQRWGATGLLLINCITDINELAVAGKENLYKVHISNEDIAGGWTESWIYKIQVRLSTVKYDGVTGQSAWLNDNSNYFSEWSTYCTTKTIGVSSLSIPVLDGGIFTGSTLEVEGSYFNTDKSENLNSYSLSLFKDGILLETSDTLYTNEYKNKIYYIFKTELEDKNTYEIKVDFLTKNEYAGTASYTLRVEQDYAQSTNILTIEAKENDFFEEEDGRVGLAISASAPARIIIRRTDDTSNFTYWEDLKELSISSSLVIYDYSIESGRYYKYGVQEVIENKRTILTTISNLVMREFFYSFLLGENEQQLRLMFNNTMSSVKINRADSKVDTIGGQYPYITRNGAMNYKTVQVAGLISFNMDENHLFLDKCFSYYSNKNFNDDNINPDEYDYHYEKEFRDAVMKFLDNGKPKLFKSPTEGNLILRLMDLNFTPNQTLDRMIYSFTSNGHEIAENNLKNIQKYKLVTKEA